jgi:hypothetical protein
MSWRRFCLLIRWLGPESALSYAIQQSGEASVTSPPSFPGGLDQPAEGGAQLPKERLMDVLANTLGARKPSVAQVKARDYRRRRAEANARAKAARDARRAGQGGDHA